jgi:hypothetical protein
MDDMVPWWIILIVLPLFVGSAGIVFFYLLDEFSRKKNDKEKT